MKYVNNYLKVTKNCKTVEVFPFDGDNLAEVSDARRRVEEIQDFSGGVIAAYRYFSGMPESYRLVGANYYADSDRESRRETR